ncbi:MAG: hypothetical protein J6X37_07155 [Treponema sp.]|nr:hypothetical protein [Treponema sp.]
MCTPAAPNQQLCAPNQKNAQQLCTPNQRNTQQLCTPNRGNAQQLCAPDQPAAAQPQPAAPAGEIVLEERTQEAPKAVKASTSARRASRKAIRK